MAQSSFRLHHHHLLEECCSFLSVDFTAALLLLLLRAPQHPTKTFYVVFCLEFAYAKSPNQHRGAASQFQVTAWVSPRFSGFFLLFKNILLGRRLATLKCP